MSPSPNPLPCSLFLIVAFTLAGLVHSAWLRSALSRRLLIPLDAGLRVRGRRVFGDNKTVRGFVSMVPAAAAAFALCFVAAKQFAPSLALELWSLTVSGYAALGAWAGLGFMLGELPNSFVKRQLDVAPGQGPRGRVGALVSFVVAVPTPWMTWVYSLLIGPGIHLAFSILLYRLGVKARPA